MDLKSVINHITHICACMKVSLGKMENVFCDLCDLVVRSSTSFAGDFAGALIFTGKNLANSSLIYQESNK